MLARKLSGAAAAARPQPTFVSSSINRVSGNNTVTAPTGIQNGDLLVAVLFHTDQNAEPITLPSGWSRLTETETADSYFVLATKTAASESGSYTFTFDVSAANTAAILVYRNATRINTVGAFTAGTTAPEITPTYAGTLVGAFAVESGRSVSTAPSGMTQRAVYDVSIPALAIFDQPNQPAASTGTKSITWSGATASPYCVLFQVTNEPSIAPEFVAVSNTSNSTNGTTLVIAKPSLPNPVIEGDLMIAVMACDTNARTWTGDTGWTEVADQGADPDLRIAYKVAGATEPSSYTFTLSGSQKTTGCILAYRYAAYDTIAGSFTTAASPLLLSSVSPSLSQSILLAAGARSATSITLGTPTSMTARFTDADANDPSFIVCDQTVAKGPTGVRSMTTGSTTGVSGIMLAITPTRSLT